VSFLNPNPSSPVSSSQEAVHPRLAEIVQRHLREEWKAGLHAPSCDSFERVAKHLDSTPSDGIILDSGCGTGESTRLISAAFPDARVIGVDRSAHRLGRLTGKPWPTKPWVYVEGNALWVRAELETFWRLALAAGWTLQRHFLLYPNPWPKAAQLRRRWHGHPVFPTLLALGGELELRTNWEIYAQEFRLALQLARGAEPMIQTLGEDDLITTPFELKYRRSGHALYRLSVGTWP